MKILCPPVTDDTRQTDRTPLTDETPCTVVAEAPGDRTVWMFDVQDQLLQRVALGNRQAFQTLYKQIEPFVKQLVKGYRVDMRAEGEDLCQEVFASIWKYRSSLVAVENIESYVFSITRNVIYRHQKLKVRRYNCMQDYSARQKSFHSPEDLKDCNKLEKDIIGLLKKLPERQKQAYLLRYLLDLPPQKVASIMGVSVNTVKNLHVEAKRKLKLHCEERLM